jgi:hypothetical protein
MFRLPSVSMFVVLVVFASQRVVAQSPLAYSHYVPRPMVDMPLRTVYADIPDSAQTLAVPTGMAFITWSVHGVVVCTAGPCGIETARFRPVIGNNFPTEGLPDNNAHSSSGSWAIPTEAGNITVKLQVAAPFALDEYDWRFKMDSSESDSRDAMSWTLVVLPNTASAGVPAIGGAGLMVLVFSLLGVGALLIARRPKASSI